MTEKTFIVGCRWGEGKKLAFGTKKGGIAHKVEKKRGMRKAHGRENKKRTSPLLRKEPFGVCSKRKKNRRKEGKKGRRETIKDFVAGRGWRGEKSLHFFWGGAVSGGRMKGTPDPTVRGGQLER